ncbi:DUF3995 domain-containing protein [Tenacibaculum xiamenense]|uniref:DUF3995 domain-containing protein n=1 Tax=Tenacibaculum xiamenense TaxID=1261553 RepID=UPI003894394D
MSEVSKKEVSNRKYKNNTLSIVLSIIFLLLSIIHVYWAFGGTWGFNNVLPETSEGVKILNPTFTDSIIVGFGLLLFSTIYLFYAKLFKVKVLIFLRAILLWLIPSIFLLRAIGDFHIVGFFKHIRNTNFAYFDNYFYSPLCLFIAVMGFIVAKRKVTISK